MLSWCRVKSVSVEIVVMREPVYDPYLCNDLATGHGVRVNFPAINVSFLIVTYIQNSNQQNTPIIGKKAPHSESFEGDPKSSLWKFKIARNK